MSSIFSKIINRELPGHFLWRDPICVSFLSINPITKGHSLVIPIQEVDHWLDLETSKIEHLTKVGHYIGLALEKIFQPDRVGMMIAGFEVPHTHLHILCVESMADMDFANAAESVEPEELAETANLIRSALIEDGREFIAED